MRAMWAFVATALVFGAGCAKQDWIDRTLVTVDVTGSWFGSVSGSGGAMGSGMNLRLELEQKGSTVKGTIQLTPDQSNKSSGPIEGTVAGDVFRFRAGRGQMEGELTVGGDEMNGEMTGSYGRRPVSLRRVDPSSPPASPPR